MLALALCSVILGIALTASPWGQRFEEQYGLHWLFNLRGPRPAPDEAVIVAIDKNAADALNLPFDTARWPRQVHADLVSALHASGARVIVFDLHFLTERPAEDPQFATALRRAGNVLLPEKLHKCIPGEENCQSNLMTQFNADVAVAVHTRSPPPPLLADAAAGIGPFTLPKGKTRIDQFWTLDPYAGDAPSLPLLALLFYTLPDYGEFRTLLQDFATPHAKELPSNAQSIVAEHRSVELAIALRDLFQESPALLKQLFERVSADATATAAPLLAAYAPPQSRYLNYFGATGAIQTYPYDQAMRLLARRDAAARDVFAGKAVFVGLSTPHQRHYKDNDDFFDTVYSASGTQLSGIEILATGFVNLLRQDTLRPLDGRQTGTVILLWGLLVAVGARLLTPLWATLTVTLLCVAYLYGSVELFGSLHVWPPLVVPLLLQAPFTLFVAVVLHQRQAARDYQLIHREFSRYLPDIAINRLVHEGFHPTRNRATLFGVCLFTDAEGYTSVAETMDSYALSTVEEEYKHTITQVIVDQRGNISDAHGDSVLAFWASRLDELSIRDDACRTVTKIHDAVEQWNEHNPYGVRFPTRIGLHCGELTLTRIGSETSYESRLVGDIVNTASRLEQLNKQLGTQQLVSAATLAGIDNVVSQYVGAFVFKGKSQPVPVHRLLGWGEEVRERWTTYRQYFAAGLHAFANADWTLAHEYFSSILTFREQDGPCLFYLKQIEQRRSLPLQPGWNGTIVVDQKLSGAE